MWYVIKHLESRAAYPGYEVTNSEYGSQVFISKGERDEHILKMLEKDIPKTYGELKVVRIGPPGAAPDYEIQVASTGRPLLYLSPIEEEVNA